MLLLLDTVQCVLGDCALDAATRWSISELTPRMMMDKRLVITADDFGYCSERNRGVVDCFLRSGITRASVLVNGEAASEASSLSKKHSLPVGESVIASRTTSDFVGRNPQGDATIWET